MHNAQFLCKLNFIQPILYYVTETNSINSISIQTGGPCSKDENQGETGSNFEDHILQNYTTAVNTWSPSMTFIKTISGKRIISALLY